MIRKISLHIVYTAVLCTLLYLLFSQCNNFTEWYCAYFINPFQKIRNYLFDAIPFSVGEVIYLMIIFLIIAAIIQICKTVKNIFSNKQLFVIQILRTIRLFGLIYLSFLLCWGGNYYRKGIEEKLHINIYEPTLELDKDKLIALNNFLVEKINQTIIGTNEAMSIAKINKEAVKQYKQQFKNKSSVGALKPSAINLILSYIGVQGYYHPLSGEGHYNKNVHYSLQPFVFVHEMAHQMGIASETDANFVAYLLCKESNNKFFKYSAYLNIYMYAQGELRGVDSIVAQNIHNSLPEITLKHLEEIKQIRIRFSSSFRKYTLNFYDSYLKVFGQEQGLNSYVEVSKLVYIWETKPEKINTDKLFK